MEHIFVHQRECGRWRLVCAFSLVRYTRRVHPRFDQLLAAYVVCIGLLACSDCDRSGCGALFRVAPSNIQIGLAGAVASQSDLVENGCQECTFANAELEIWQVNSANPDAETARQVVEAEPPFTSVEVERRYELPLQPNAYLVCHLRNRCVGVRVLDTGVTTLHLKLVNGPTQFVVGEPGQGAPLDAVGISLEDEVAF